VSASCPIKSPLFAPKNTRCFRTIGLFHQVCRSCSHELATLAPITGHHPCSERPSNTLVKHDRAGSIFSSATRSPGRLMSNFHPRFFDVEIPSTCDLSTSQSSALQGISPLFPRITPPTDTPLTHQLHLTSAPPSPHLPLSGGHPHPMASTRAHSPAWLLTPVPLPAIHARSNRKAHPHSAW